MSGRPWFWHTAMFETTSRVRIMDARCVSLHVSTLSLLKIHLHLCQKLWMLPVSLLHCLFPSFSLPSSTKILRSQFLHFLHLFSNWVFISMIFFELRQNIEIFQCFDFIKNYYSVNMGDTFCTNETEKSQCNESCFLFRNECFPDKPHMLYFDLSKYRERANMWSSDIEKKLRLFVIVWYNVNWLLNETCRFWWNSKC